MPVPLLSTENLSDLSGKGLKIGFNALCPWNVNAFAYEIGVQKLSEAFLYSFPSSCLGMRVGKLRLAVTSRIGSCSLRDRIPKPDLGN